MNAAAMAAATNKVTLAHFLLSLRLSLNSVLNTGVPLPQAHRPLARWPGSETAAEAILFGLNDGEVQEATTALPPLRRRAPSIRHCGDCTTKRNFCDNHEFCF